MKKNLTIEEELFYVLTQNPLTLEQEIKRLYEEDEDEDEDFGENDTFYLENFGYSPRRIKPEDY